MEFWGVEVEAGKPLKVTPEDSKLIHISQASLGEVKDVKSAKKNVTLRLKFDTRDFILGHLSAQDKPQFVYDLVFDREFELSHDCESGSVYFMGYIASKSHVSDYYDSDAEGHNAACAAFCAETHGVAGAAKCADNAEIKKEGLSDSDDSDSLNDDDNDDDSDDDNVDDSEDDDVDDSEDDDEEDIPAFQSLNGDEVDSEDDSVEEEDSESSEEELPNLKPLKKRPAGPAQETIVPAKKAKSSTPDKRGNKKGQNPTPPPAKAAGKTQFGNKSKQTPKSGGQFNKSSNFKNSKGKR